LLIIKGLKLFSITQKIPLDTDLYTYGASLHEDDTAPNAEYLRRLESASTDIHRPAPTTLRFGTAAS
jgi:hypothetical protein